MRFLAIGKHGDFALDDALAIAEPQLAWLEAALAAGTIDCAYGVEGGGRLIIAEATSREALLEQLQAVPDLPREWTITALTDACQVIRDYLRTNSSN